MIHNPAVNHDLQEMGIRFIMDNYGEQLIGWDTISNNDIVIIPAFGTTVEIENLLRQKGIDTVKFNTTCPFVERVWNKADSLGKQNFTVIIHGKYKHEETRATFSHAVQNAPSVIIRNCDEALFLTKIILGAVESAKFYEFFKDRFSEGFDVERDLKRLGVVNQTTMLASETETISALLKGTMRQKYGVDNLKDHFADTRDTLCYATNDNQQSIYGLLEKDADLALVVGGYNSSNTTHLVELFERKFNTYFISDPEKIISQTQISHFDIYSKEEKITDSYLPSGNKITIAIASGASCPDSIVDQVLQKILSFYPDAKSLESVLKDFAI